MSCSNISKSFSGEGTTNMSAIYGYNYENITLNVGTRSDVAPIYAINVTSEYAFMPNGSIVPALEQLMVPFLLSLASGANKCFVYNMTQYPLVNEFRVNIDYYKVETNRMVGFLILPKNARGAGMIFFILIETMYATRILYMRFPLKS
jgi:hypothetical protein